MRRISKYASLLACAVEPHELEAGCCRIPFRYANTPFSDAEKTPFGGCLRLNLFGIGKGSPVSTRRRRIKRLCQKRRLAQEEQ